MTYLLLGILGLGICIYSIIEASQIPERTPMRFGLESALTFAAGVGAVVFTLSFEPDHASACVILACVLQALLFWDARRRGYVVRAGFVDFRVRVGG